MPKTSMLVPLLQKHPALATLSQVRPKHLSLLYLRRLQLPRLLLFKLILEPMHQQLNQSCLLSDRQPDTSVMDSSRPTMESRLDMASSPPTTLSALSNPSKLTSKLLLPAMAAMVLSRKLEAIPSLPATIGHKHQADLRISAKLASPDLAPVPATAGKQATVSKSRQDTVAPEAATEATVVAKTTATAETAAMALPTAVLSEVMVVDLVEDAPMVVDKAVPDMEAQEGGEELSFCVYGLNA